METSNVTCPVCNGSMVQRTNRNNGKAFHGCKAYPRCKGTRSISTASKASYSPWMVIDALGGDQGRCSDCDSVLTTSISMQLNRCTGCQASRDARGW